MIFTVFSSLREISKDVEIKKITLSVSVFVVLLLIFGCAGQKHVSSETVEVDRQDHRITWSEKLGESIKKQELYVHVMEESEGKIRNIGFSADGKYLISGTQSRPYSNLLPVRIWDVKTGELINTYRGRGRGIFALATAPEGDIVATAGLDSVIRIWNFKTGEVLHKIEVPRTQNIRSLRFSPDGKKIACGTYGLRDSSKQVNAHYLWQIDSKRLIHSDTYPNSVEDLEFSPDGKILASAFRGGENLRLWDIENNKQLPGIANYNFSGVRSLNFFPDGRHLLVTPSGINVTAFIYDYRSNYVASGDLGRTDRAVLSSDGNKIVTYNYTESPAKTDRGNYKVIDPQSGEVFYEFDEDTYVYQILLSPDGTQLASALAGSKIKIREIPPVKKGFALVNQLMVSELALLLGETKYSQIKNKEEKLSEFAFPVFKRLFHENFAVPVIQDVSFDIINNSYNFDVVSNSARIVEFKQRVSLNNPARNAREIEEFKEKLKNINPVIEYEFDPQTFNIKWHSGHVTVDDKTYPLELASEVQEEVIYKLSLEMEQENIDLADPEISKLHKELVEKKEQLEKEMEQRSARQRLQEQIQKLEEQLNEYEANIVTGSNNYEDDLLEKVAEKKRQKIAKNTYVFIVGIENYSQAPDVDYSNRTARLFAEAADKLLGVPKENIMILTGDLTTGSAIKGYLDIVLNRIDEDDVLYFYYAGHGVPSRNKPRSYILPRDAVVGSYEDERFALNNLYDRLSNSKARRVYAFIDACFSGRATKDSLIFEQVAPAGHLTRGGGFPSTTSDNLTVFTAGKEDQFANALPEKGHRLFGYYIIRGLLEERKGIDFYEFVRERVSEVSRRKGPAYNQLPQLYGKIILDY